MSSSPVAIRRPSLVTSTAVIAKRNLLKFVRTPQLVLVTAVQGAIFFLAFRYVFGGAIRSGGLSYVDFLVPGFVTINVIFSGMAAAAGVAEDREQGFFDRLRSLPIPRSSVLSGRAIADTGTQVLGLLIMTAVAFAVGFRLHAPVGDALLAFALIVAFTFAFEWVFITLGLYSPNAQAAQGISMMLIPLVFISSAFVPVQTMPSGLRSVAEHQPVTYVIDSVRTLGQGASAEALLGHPAAYFVTRALIWLIAIVLVFALIAVARYRRG